MDEQKKPRRKPQMALMEVIYQSGNRVTVPFKTFSKANEAESLLFEYIGSGNSHWWIATADGGVRLALDGIEAIRVRRVVSFEVVQEELS